ncbi:MAG: adenosylmethionine decarboxylase [Deltaproteobacteria bacterium]|nr:adenosylmethionine decarboxylase [Deltaproteobacteria bacterium]
MPHTSALGTHHLLDLFGVGAALLDDQSALKATLSRCARDGGATILATHFRRFEPQGVTGVVILAESHVTIHTWPERGAATLDVFTCGDPSIGERIVEGLVAALPSEEHRVTSIARGMEPPSHERKPGEAS